MIKLGQIAKHSVNGFEGLVTSELKSLNGEHQFKLQPTSLVDGKVAKEEWFDAYLLETIEDKPRFEIQKRTIGFTNGVTK